MRPSNGDRVDQAGGPVIGGMRFSVVSALSLGRWKATRHISFEESVARIFAEARMASRFRLFEAVTLPFFRHAAQRSAAFRLCLLTSPLMPARWRDRLNGLIADIPQIEAIPVQTDESPQHRFKAYVKQQIAPDQQLICTFRLDDDDVVYADHLDDLQAATHPARAGKIIAHENGLYIAHSAEKGLVYKDMKYLSNAFGIAHVSRAKRFLTIYDLGNHAELVDHHPVEVLRAPRSWIRSIHGTADTAKKAPDVRSWRPLAEIEDDVRRLYPFLDLGKVTEAMRGC